MKITQLMLSAGFGGAERYFVDLCHALQRRGHEVQVIWHRNFVAKDDLEAEENLQLESFPTTTSDQKRYLLDHRVDESMISVILNFSSVHVGKVTYRNHEEL